MPPRTRKADDDSHVAEVVEPEALGDVEPLELPPEEQRRRRFEMVLGVPFALVDGSVELLEPDDGIPGCFASLQCECGEAFKIDLLSDKLKACPGCGVKYTHALLLGREDDVMLAQDFVNEVLEANGLQPMGEDGEPDDADDDDDEPDDDDDNDDGRE